MHVAKAQPVHNPAQETSECSPHTDRLNTYTLYQTRNRTIQALQKTLCKLVRLMLSYYALVLLGTICLDGKKLQGIIQSIICIMVFGALKDAPALRQ